MFKKILLTIAAFSALSGLSYGLANPDLSANVPGIAFKTSTNVNIVYKWDATGASTQLYTIGSKHTSGNTYYATSNMSTAIYKKLDDAKKGVALTTDDAYFTGLPAGDSLFTAVEGYSPM